MMRAKEQYTQVIRDEVAATEFFRRYQLEQPVDIAPCSKCGGEMAEKRRKIKGESRPVCRCSKKGCQIFRSVCHESIFFCYTDLNNKMNCKLTLCEILELVFYFVKDLSLDLTEEMTGRSRPTVCDWFNMCREVCSSIVFVNRRGKMVETAVNPVERDEARFAEEEYTIEVVFLIVMKETNQLTVSYLGIVPFFIFFSIFFIYFIIYFYLSILSIYSIFLSILNYRGVF